MNAPTRPAAATTTDGPAPQDFRHSGGFLVRLAEKLGPHGHARSVFGEPVTQGEVTVVPVAKVRWGFGGGQGHGAAAIGKATNSGDMVGAGGGGGVMVTPLGYIELKNGQSRYRPIVDPVVAVPLAIAGGLAGVVLLRAVVRTLRGR
jgi:uncharacterized spore protein YtfJ